MTCVINCPGCNKRIRVAAEPTDLLVSDDLPQWATPAFICRRCGGTASVARSIEPHRYLRRALIDAPTRTLAILNRVTRPSSPRSAPRLLVLVRCDGPISTQVGLAQTETEAILLGQEFAQQAFRDEHRIDHPHTHPWRSLVQTPAGARYWVYSDGHCSAALDITPED